jgi:hypothetical protein
MYRLCGVDFRDFWRYTPAETYAMLEVGHDKLIYETVQHAQILMWIANAPHFRTKDKKPHEIEEFLPDFAKSATKHEMTPEECERAWLKACR